VCKIALNVLANMGAQTALNYAISAHRCSYLIALFHSSPKRLQLRHKDILPSPPSLNNSAQDKEKGEKKKKLHKGLSTEMSLQLAALEQEEQAPQPVSEIL
jgi:hypothetical protein